MAIHDRSLDCFAALAMTSDLKFVSYLAICGAGSRSDVRVRSPGQVRKEAAQVDGSGSAGSFLVFPQIPVMTNRLSAPS